MALKLNIFKCNRLTPLHFKRLTVPRMSVCASALCLPLTRERTALESTTLTAQLIMLRENQIKELAVKGQTSKEVRKLIRRYLRPKRSQKRQVTEVKVTKPRNTEPENVAQLLHERYKFKIV